MDPNPFAVLTLVAAPAVLTNAMSVLALGSGNRAARAVDRFREIARELEKLDPAAPTYATRLRQLDRLERRARYLTIAMKAFFRALGSFAGTSLVAVIGGGLASLEFPRMVVWSAGILALGIVTFGVLCLLYGCVLLVRDSRLAVENLAEEAALVRSKTSRP